jgi:hypothetical protein
LDEKARGRTILEALWLIFERKGTEADDSEALWLITISVIWNWKNMIKC